jgi:hypothetical protein
MATVWITLAVVGGVLVIGIVGRFLWSLRPQPEMSGVPTAPLERLGWIGVGVTLVVGIGLAVLAVSAGTDFLEENTTARGIFWLLMIIGFGVWGASWYLIKRRSGGAVVDERDRAILARSLSVESVIVLLSLVTWTIILTEMYRDEGVMPIAYLQLVFWTTFVGGAFGRSLGIVMGYRREIVVDA